MTTTYVSGSALAQHAAEQIGRGRQLWAEHPSQPSGMCGGCGRSYPCEDALRGAWLIVYWQPYVPELALVRPYVTAPR
jgi:hypothetical protein